VSAQALGLEPMSCLGGQLLPFAPAGKLTRASQTQGAGLVGGTKSISRPSDLAVLMHRQADIPSATRHELVEKAPNYSVVRASLTWSMGTSATCSYRETARLPRTRSNKSRLRWLTARLLDPSGALKIRHEHLAN